MGGVVTIAARSSKGGLGAMLPSTLDHKDHEISMADQLMMPTRRLINPYVVTPTTILMPISMPAIASRTVVPSGIR